MTNSETDIKRSPIFPYLTKEQEEECLNEFLELDVKEWIRCFNVVLGIDEKEVKKYEWPKFNN